MAITQLSVVLDNTVGRLGEVARLLGDEGVSIRGFCVGGTADHGILRLIVDKPAEAVRVLRDFKFTVHEGPVIVARVPDRPGGLADAMDGFAKAGLNVEYAYVAVPAAVLAFGVGDVEKGEKILTDAGIPLVDAEELKQL